MQMHGYLEEVDESAPQYVFIPTYPRHSPQPYCPQQCAVKWQRQAWPPQTAILHALKITCQPLCDPFHPAALTARLLSPWNMSDGRLKREGRKIDGLSWRGVGRAGGSEMFWFYGFAVWSPTGSARQCLDPVPLFFDVGLSSIHLWFGPVTSGNFISSAASLPHVSDRWVCDVLLSIHLRFGELLCRSVRYYMYGLPAAFKKCKSLWRHFVRF